MLHITHHPWYHNGNHKIREIQCHHITHNMSHIKRHTLHFKGCHSVVREVLEEEQGVLPWYVTGVLLGFYRSVTGVLQGQFMGVTILIQGPSHFALKRWLFYFMLQFRLRLRMNQPSPITAQVTTRSTISPWRRLILPKAYRPSHFSSEMLLIWVYAPVKVELFRYVLLSCCDRPWSCKHTSKVSYILVFRTPWTQDWVIINLGKGHFW